MEKIELTEEERKAYIDFMALITKLEVFDGIRVPEYLDHALSHYEKMLAKKVTNLPNY